MSQKKRRSVRAFFSTFCISMTVLLCAFGLLLADHNSRVVRDGSRAEDVGDGVRELLTLTKAQRAAFSEGAHLLPAKVRVLGELWLLEREGLFWLFERENFT